MKTLSEKLRDLPKRSPHRSASARIQEIIEDVEYAQSQGVSYKELVRELEKAGLALSVAALRSALRRYRQKQATASGKTSSANTAKSQPSTASTVTSERDDDSERILWEKGILERFDTGKGLISVMTTEVITISDYRAE